MKKIISLITACLLCVSNVIPVFAESAQSKKYIKIPCQYVVDYSIKQTDLVGQYENNQIFIDAEQICKLTSYKFTETDDSIKFTKNDFDDTDNKNGWHYYIFNKADSTLEECSVFYKTPKKWAINTRTANTGHILFSLEEILNAFNAVVKPADTNNGKNSAPLTVYNYSSIFNIIYAGTNSIGLYGASTLSKINEIELTKKDKAFNALFNDYSGEYTLAANSIVFSEEIVKLNSEDYKSILLTTLGYANDPIANANVWYADMYPFGVDASTNDNTNDLSDIFELTTDISENNEYRAKYQIELKESMQVHEFMNTVTDYIPDKNTALKSAADEINKEHTDTQFNKEFANQITAFEETSKSYNVSNAEMSLSDYVAGCRIISDILTYSINNNLAKIYSDSSCTEEDVKNIANMFAFREMLNCIQNYKIVTTLNDVKNDYNIFHEEGIQERVSWYMHACENAITQDFHIAPDDIKAKESLENVVKPYLSDKDPATDENEIYKEFIESEKFMEYVNDSWYPDFSYDYSVSYKIFDLNQDGKKELLLFFPESSSYPSDWGEIMIFNLDENYNVKQIKISDYGYSIYENTLHDSSTGNSFRYIKDKKALAIVHQRYWQGTYVFHLYGLDKSNNAIEKIGSLVCDKALDFSEYPYNYYDKNDNRKVLTENEFNNEIDKIEEIEFEKS